LKEIAEVRKGSIKVHTSHTGSCEEFSKDYNPEAAYYKLLIGKNQVLTKEEFKRRKATGELMFRTCPNPTCPRPIEHAKACLHMICDPGCGAHFCFLCGFLSPIGKGQGPVYKHMDDAHGGWFLD